MGEERMIRGRRAGDKQRRERGALTADAEDSLARAPSGPVFRWPSSNGEEDVMMVVVLEVRCNPPSRGRFVSDRWDVRRAGCWFGVWDVGDTSRRQFSLGC